MRLEKIIDEGIEQKEITPQAKALLSGLYALEKGFVVIGGTEKENRIDIQMKQFLDALMTLIKVNDDR